MPSEMSGSWDIQRRLASRLGLALLVLSPLFFFRALEDAYVLPQRAVALAGLLLAFWGLSSQAFNRSRLLMLALAFFAWRLFTQGAGLGQGLDLPWLVEQMAPLGALVLMAHAGRDEAVARRLWRWAALSSALVAAYALIQLAGLDPWDKGAVNMGFLKRAHGSLGNPDFLAGFLVLAAPAWALHWSEKGLSLRQRCFRATAGLLFLCLLLTQVRGAWLAGAIAVPLALVAGRGRWQGRPLAFLLGLGLLAVLVLSWPGRSNPAQQSPWARVQASWSGDGALSGRRAMARVGWDLAKAHPWLGVGPGRFQSAYLEEQGRLLNLPQGQGQPYLFTADIHDDWLQCLAESGWLGLGLLAGVFTLALRAAWRRASLQGAALVGLFWAMGVQALFHFPFSVQASAIFFWGAVGLASAWDEARLPASEAGAPLPWAWLCLPLALGLALTARQSLASAALNSGTVLRDLGREGEALPLLQRAAQLWPEDTRAWMRLGSAQDQVGHGDEAMASFARVIKILPGLPEAWTDLGLALGKAGRLAEAQSATEQALALNPRSPETWSNLAKLRYLQGDGSGALDDLQKGLAQAGPSALLYLNLGVIHLNRGERASARAALEQCLKLQPDEAQAKELLQGLAHAP
jgi:Flp pilus assembly protein TadD/O-antigen ligase